MPSLSIHLPVLSRYRSANILSLIIISYFFRTSMQRGLTSLLIWIHLLTQMLLVALCRVQKTETVEYQSVPSCNQSHRNIPDLFFFTCVYILSRTRSVYCSIHWARKYKFSIIGIFAWNLCIFTFEVALYHQ